mmetsp:Transcript_46983/g.111834  ORF Transcript_46983/g.111834 Transcript_46983/m.111834 type:complete len:251 (-) Transcript_46983:975-1727(-)
MHFYSESCAWMGLRLHYVAAVVLPSQQTLSMPPCDPDPMTSSAESESASSDGPRRRALVSPPVCQAGRWTSDEPCLRAAQPSHSPCVNEFPCPKSPNLCSLSECACASNPSLYRSSSARRISPSGHLSMVTSPLWVFCPLHWWQTNVGVVWKGLKMTSQLVLKQPLRRSKHPQPWSLSLETHHCFELPLDHPNSKGCSSREAVSPERSCRSDDRRALSSAPRHAGRILQCEAFAESHPQIDFCPSATSPC